MKTIIFTAVLGFFLSISEPSLASFLEATPVSSSFHDSSSQEHKHSKHLKWKGIKQFGTSETERGYFSVSDNQGNLYITGYTGGDLDGAGPGINEGDWDIYITKLDPKGNVKWTKQFGSPGEDLAVAIAMDSRGFIYITGQIGGDLDPNDDQIYRGKVEEPGHVEEEGERDGDDAFLMKLNADGDIQWLRQFGIEDDDAGFALAIDRYDNPFVAGYTWGDLDGIGPGIHSGQEDIYLTKFNASGNQLWIRQIGTEEPDIAYAMALDKYSGNLYLTGFTTGRLTESENSSLNIGGQDIVALKFNAQGKLKWIRQLGTEEDDNGFAITVDRGQKVLISGYVSGDLDGNGPDLYAGDFDFAVIKLNQRGDTLWTRQLGTEGNDFGLGISVDYHGSTYATGTVFGDLDGSGPQTYQGKRDVALIKFGRNGKTEWIRQWGTPLNDWGFHVAAERRCHVRVTGQTGEDLDGFGPQSFAGVFDNFVLRVGDDKCGDHEDDEQ